MLPPLRANDIRTAADLACHYRQYLRVINQGTVDLLPLFVARSIKYNDKTISLNTFATMLPKGANVYPHDIVTDVGARTLAARLHVEVPISATAAAATASGANGTHDMNGLNGRSPKMSSPSPVPSPSSCAGVEQYQQMVFYRFDENWHISQVWSSVDHRCSSVRKAAARSA